ncbi:PTPDL family protein [Rubritalea sp.]|uniref:PTPDL family protein n=1 Tax=Rubritalea sp. TaxID=2109375 RepID=UPI003EF32EF9
MKKTLFLTLSLGLTLSSLYADTYTLKNGLEYTGKISLETDDSYYLLVEEKPGVRKEIAVKKADIESISKSNSGKATRDFILVEKLVPTPDFLSEEDYERAITSVVDPYLEKYPNSLQAKQALAIRKTLAKEQEQVKSGALKINGEFTTEAERITNAYEIDAALLANIISKQARSKNYSEAFVAFAEMADNYKHTLPFEDTLKKAIDLCKNYENEAKQIVSSADDTIEKRDKALDAMTTDTRIRAKQALADEDRAYQAQLTKAKNANNKWLPLNRFHPDVAKQTLSSLRNEQSRLQRLAEESDSIDAGAIYREVWVAFDQNDLDLAKVKIRELSRARVPDQYVGPLEKKLSEAIETRRELEHQKREEEREALEKAREAASLKQAEELDNESE